MKASCARIRGSIPFALLAACAALAGCSLNPIGEDPGVSSDSRNASADGVFPSPTGSPNQDLSPTTPDIASPSTPAASMGGPEASATDNAGGLLTPPAAEPAAGTPTPIQDPGVPSPVTPTPTEVPVIGAAGAANTGTEPAIPEPVPEASTPQPEPAPTGAMPMPQDGGVDATDGDAGALDAGVPALTR